MSITLGQLASKFAKAAQETPEVLDKKMRVITKLGEGIMKREIQKVHAVDTGTMLNSVTTEAAGNRSYLIGPTVKYAPYVALGTSRMPARPFHISAAKQLEAQLPEILKAGDLGL